MRKKNINKIFWIIIVLILIGLVLGYSKYTSREEANMSIGEDHMSIDTDNTILEEDPVALLDEPAEKENDNSYMESDQNVWKEYSLRDTNIYPENKDLYKEYYLDNAWLGLTDEEKGYNRYYKFTPMFAYSYLTGRGYQNKNAGMGEYFSQFLVDTNKRVYDFGYDDYYTIDPNYKKYAMRILNKEYAVQQILNDGVLEDTWNFADQLVYNPDGSKLSYRVRDEDKWRIVTNGVATTDSWEYVHLVAYTSNGDFYYIIKDTVDGKEKWLMYKNGDIIHEYDYIDSIMYGPKADYLIFRAKEIVDGVEKWFIVVDDKEGYKYQYVEGLAINYDLKEVFYKISDSNIDIDQDIINLD